MIIVYVHAGNVHNAGNNNSISGEQEIKNLKRKMQRELVYRAMKIQRFHEPDSVKRLRKKQETARRIKKFARKKYMND